MARFINPIDGLFPDIDKILNFMIIKNKNEADKYETDESRRDAAMYINAVLFQDSFFMYHPIYTIDMFQKVNPTVRLKDAQHYLNNIYNTPEYYREPLRVAARQKLIAAYDEKNDYYRKLAGLPPYGTQAADFIYLPITLQMLFNVGPNVPVHELSDTLQNKLVITKEYELMLQQNSNKDGVLYPEKEYLQFLGVYKVQLVVSRRARDFELIRYVPNEKSSINPYLLKMFGTIYNEYRDYVMLTLYNKELEDLMVNYREYMQLTIIFLVLMQISPRTVESCLDNRFFDDRIIQIIFDMYNIPRDAVISKDVRRRLVVRINKMIQNKATNQVFYNILDVLGYKDTKISKFLFVKQQEYTDDGFHTAIFEDNERMVITDTFQTYAELPKYTSEWTNPYNLQIGMNVVVLADETHEFKKWTYTLKDIIYPEAEQKFDVYGRTIVDPSYAVDITRGGKLLWSAGQPRQIPKTDVYFQAIDLKEYDQYTAIKNQQHAYSYNEITGGDPRWWELDDVKELVRGKNYTIADSKYIMVDTIIDQSQMLFETVYFMRMIIDNKISTDRFLFTIPEVFGSTLVSLFDAMVFILAAMCEENNLTGEIITSASGLLACAGFNFDLDMKEFEEFLRRSNYIDKERILEMLSDLSMRDISDVNRIFNELMIPLRDWLTIEMSRSDNKEKFLEYEKCYRAIFCYDAMRQVFVDNFESPEQLIMTQYDIPELDYLAYKAFYPHWPNKTTDGIAGDLTSGYFPFLGNTIELVKQYTFVIPGYPNPVHIYDILNTPDLRYTKDNTGVEIKNPLFWDENAIYGQDGLLAQIDEMDPDMLRNAFFKVHTATDDGRYIVADTPLPMSIKSKFKQILRNKVEMDYFGWAKPPETYKEYLMRKNRLFYDLFRDHQYDHDKFLNELMAIVKAIEEELDFRLKYFDRFVGGDALFYEPLILLIKYFKSYMVDFARSATSFIIKDKFDAGGNCNMFKLFDEFGLFSINVAGMNEKSFGLYDATSYVNHIPDIKEKLITRDRVKFWINGETDDKWYTGEPDTGMYVVDEFA